MSNNQNMQPMAMDTSSPEKTKYITVQQYRIWQAEAKAKEEELQVTITELIDQNKNLASQLAVYEKRMRPRTQSTSFTSTLRVGPTVGDGSTSQQTVSESSSQLEDQSVGNSTTQSQKNKNKVYKPPPITVSGVYNFKLFKELIYKKLDPESVTYKATNENGKIIVTVKTEEQFRSLISHLKEFIDAQIGKPKHTLSRLAYHTYKLKNEKPYRVVVRGLPATTDIEEIKQEFLNEGHVAVRVTNIKKTIKKRNENREIVSRETKIFPIFNVELEPKENNIEA